MSKTTNKFSPEVRARAVRVWQKREEEHRERLASIRAWIQNSIDDPRPSLSLEEARGDFRCHVEARAKSIP